MEKERKKVGLALGGGGARGFCHIGVLQVFEENNIPIDVVTGCSMGSIVGGCYVSGMEPSKMEIIATKFKQSIITDFDPLLRNQGFFKGNRSINFIKKHIGDKNIEDCPIPFAATTVDAKLGELIVISEGSIIEAMRASFSIPVAFQHTTACGRGCLIDGGIIERIPINSAKELGADVVIAVDAIGEPEPIENIKGILEMINRVYFLLDWQGWQHKQKDADLIIMPNQPGKMVHDFKNNLKSIKAGREAAEKMLPQIKELVAAL